jgi:hypothetical protein
MFALASSDRRSEDIPVEAIVIRFARAASSSASIAVLILMPVFGEAADESFINLDKRQVRDNRPN